MSEKGKTHMNELLPKPHIRTTDIPAGGVTVKARGWGMVEIYDQKTRRHVEKGVLYLHKTEKYLIMNQTKIDQISQVLGSEYIEDWFGKPVRLVVEEIKTGFGLVDSIQIRPAPSSNGSGEKGQPKKVEPDTVLDPDSTPLSVPDPDRYKMGVARTKEDYQSLCSELGIDKEQAAAILKEKLGEPWAAYDYLLKEHAGAILKGGAGE